MFFRRWIPVAASMLVAVASGSAATAQDVPQRAVDAVFESFDGTENPGCAVAVGRHGRTVMTRAYGMADLEHDVPNTPATVFEPGSVSKQFTAAATILLALDGALSLDDDVRKHFPELPDYGEKITIRHLLNHTSGLRDWGSIAAIEGWPRTRRAHTHTHVLDIASRQKSLNYPPGEYYSYTNTGYNLQAMLVERVSGMSFAEFSKKRIFEPLGMTRTEWRDDFTDIVEDRAIAYSPTEGGYRLNMPFENVHGNGGLLTTVEDLLRFTHNLETGELGGPAFLEEMHRQGVLNSGREIAYASGLVIGEYKGVREVQHSGGTAGYRGFLTRFPDQGVAVSVMCNAGQANPGRLARSVADLYLADAILDEETELDEADPFPVSDARLEALAGGYRNTRTQALLRLVEVDGGLRAANTVLRPSSATRFSAPVGVVVEFDDAPDGERVGAELATPDGSVVRIEPVDPFEPTPEELAAYEGVYRSDEAEATYTVAVENGTLVMKNRYGDGVPLRPAYRDAFAGRGSGITFRRADGRIVGLSMVQSRVWDLRFQRIR